MRLFAVLTLVVALAPTLAAGSQEPQDSLAVTVARLDDRVVAVSWSAAPGAVAYDVWRGPTPDTLEWVGRTSGLQYVDSTAPVEDVWYVILGDGIATQDFTRGKCLAMRGGTGISITLAHCIPNRSA